MTEEPWTIRARSVTPPPKMTDADRLDTPVALRIIARDYHGSANVTTELSELAKNALVLIRENVP